MLRNDFINVSFLFHSNDPYYKQLDSTTRDHNNLHAFQLQIMNDKINVLTRNEKKNKNENICIYRV